MKNNTIRIVTRKSKLALWQANWVKSEIEKKHPGLRVELLGITTPGDQRVDVPLTEVGGKSVFVKTLQHALLKNEADIAVHCVKDMSVHETKGLMLTAVCKREDPRDAFISDQANTLDALKPQPIIGTASPRRATLLRSLRPDCQIKLLRGNVNTRLEKCAKGEYDAIILAAAGLHRLNLAQRIQSYLDPISFIPAIGQGAIAIECRTDDEHAKQHVSFLHDIKTSVCITAEKAVNQVLKGDCHTPIGAHAVIQGNDLIMRAIVGSTDGKNILHSKGNADISKPKILGQKIANDLLSQGAAELLESD